MKKSTPGHPPSSNCGRRISTFGKEFTEYSMENVSTSVTATTGLSSLDLIGVLPLEFWECCFIGPDWSSATRVLGMLFL